MKIPTKTERLIEAASATPPLTAATFNRYRKWCGLNYLVNECPIPAVPETARRLARLKLPEGWQSWEQICDANEVLAKKIYDDRLRRLEAALARKLTPRHATLTRQ